MMKKIVCLLALLLCSGSGLAVQNADISGVLKHVYTYTDEDYIFFNLENQPISHPSCRPDWFVIDGSVPADRRKALLSRLLLAYSMGEPVQIGYDGTGNCSARGYIRVHRVG